MDRGLVEITTGGSRISAQDLKTKDISVIDLSDIIHKSIILDDMRVEKQGSIVIQAYLINGKREYVKLYSTSFQLEKMLI